MLRHLSEEFILVVHVLKWLILAAMVGVLVGLTSTGFIRLLSLVTELKGSLTGGIWILPFGLACSAWITTHLVPEAGGQGVERVIRAIHLQSGKIRWQVIPAKIAATLLTIGTGGSAGNIGPCVQIGSGLSAWAADFIQFDSQNRKTLVICGLSAGFAAVLGSPLAGAIFGLEALFVGSLTYHVLFPSVVASLMGYSTAIWTGMPALHFSAPPFPPLDLGLLSLALVAGSLSGVTAMILVECLHGAKRIASSLPTSVMVKGFLGGGTLIGLSFFVSPQVLGLGTEVIQVALRGEGFIWTMALGKILATSITLGFGGSGGIVLPICFIGATSGSVLGYLLNQDSGLFAALGFAGLLAGAINTPLTATFLGIELFGLSSGPYMILTCTMAFLLSGHRSAIPTQLLQLQKAPALEARINEEIGGESSEKDASSG